MFVFVKEFLIVCAAETEHAGKNPNVLQLKAKNALPSGAATHELRIPTATYCSTVGNAGRGSSRKTGPLPTCSTCSGTVPAKETLRLR